MLNTARVHCSKGVIQIKYIILLYLITLFLNYFNKRQSRKKNTPTVCLDAHHITLCELNYMFWTAMSVYRIYYTPKSLKTKYLPIKLDKIQLFQNIKINNVMYNGVWSVL